VIKLRYQLLAHGRWFSLGTPTSSTTKTGRHDIAEILLKVALNTKNQIKSSFYSTELQCIQNTIYKNKGIKKCEESWSEEKYLIKWQN